MNFLGNCIGVTVSNRDTDDLHQMVTLMIEDDGLWFHKMTVSSHWLNEMIEQLQAARSHLVTNCEKEKDGLGYRRVP